jgi:hypothetical protein
MITLVVSLPSNNQLQLCFVYFWGFKRDWCLTQGEILSGELIGLRLAKLKATWSEGAKTKGVRHLTLSPCVPGAITWFECAVSRTVWSFMRGCITRPLLISIFIPLSDVSGTMPSFSSPQQSSKCGFSETDRRKVCFLALASIIPATF